MKKRIYIIIMIYLKEGNFVEEVIDYLKKLHKMKPSTFIGVWDSNEADTWLNWVKEYIDWLFIMAAYHFGGNLTCLASTFNGLLPLLMFIQDLRNRFTYLYVMYGH